MQARRVLLTLLVAVCATCQITPINQYAYPYAGAEVLDFPSPTLAYASNLAWDSANPAQYPRLFFIADKGAPNLYVAQFDPAAQPGADHAFWSTGKSPLGGASPFFSFSINGDTVIGPAYPTNFTQNPVPGFVIQLGYVPAEGTPTADNTPGSVGYTYLSALIDPKSQGGIQYVYLTAWSNDDLVVVRGQFTAGVGAIVVIDPQRDIRPVDSAEKCYDQYSPHQTPQMFLTDTSLILSVPGRCSAFYKFSLPSGGLPWNTAFIVYYDPTDTNAKYVSSSAFDSKTMALYYAVKQYNAAGSTIFALDTQNWVPISASLDAGIAEGETILTLGTAPQNVTYLFVTGAGADVINRYTVNAQHVFTPFGTAVLDLFFNQVSSALYVHPFIYFTTYEPNAKLVRIRSDNFCNPACGTFSYCDSGKCLCKEGYMSDVTQPNAPCAPTKQVQCQVQERQSSGAAAALGVLFAFSLLAAAVGWFLWWKNKRGYASVQ